MILDVGIYVACTGAGLDLQKTIWSIPGSSEYFMGGVFPYSRHALKEFLGFEPDHYCDENTAIDMAMKSYICARLALEDNKNNSPPMGIGITATVATTIPKKGGYRCHIAVIGPDAYLSKRIDLTNNDHMNDRIEARLNHEEEITEAFYKVLEEFTLERSQNAKGDSSAFKARLLAHPVFTNNKRFSLEEWLKLNPFYASYIPGTFNPLHQGHIEMAEYLEQDIYTPTAFMINIDQPHKPPITVSEALDRAAMVIATERPVIFTEGMGMYLDKLTKIPGRYGIGMDTIKRMFSVNEEGHLIYPWTRPDEGVSIYPYELAEDISDTNSYIVGFPRNGIDPTPFIKLIDHDMLLAEGYHSDFSSTKIREQEDALRKKS